MRVTSLMKVDYSPQRLGHTAEARQWLDKAVQVIDQDAKEKRTNGGTGGALSYRERLELRVLRAEAEALIHPPAGPKQ